MKRPGRSVPHASLPSSLLACALLACAACAGPREADAPPARSASAPPPATQPATQPATPTAPAADAAACAAVAGWRSEIIPLPPEFAPALPAGQEELRFAPGMFDPEAETYFSYAFVLRLAGSAPLDRARVETLLDQYYRGLVAAVASERELALPDDVDATVTGDASGFRATVSMYDAFVTGKPLTLHMDVTVEGSCVRAAASPRPRDHRVWQDLARATACLACQP
jgi:hypothetical protein